MVPIFILLAILNAFLWGIQPVIHKQLLKKINSITLMMISSIVFIIALIITVLFSQTYQSFIGDIRKLNANDYFIIIITALITSFLANMIYYYILKDNESSIVSAFISTAPIFTLIVSYLFLNERLEAIGIIGIILMFLGVVCVSLNNNTAKLFEFFNDVF